MIETEIFDENDDVIFPLTITERNGETTYRSFEFLKPRLENVINGIDNPFCKESIEKFDVAIFETIDALGYEKQDVCDEWYYIFGSKNNVQMPDIDVEIIDKSTDTGNPSFNETDLDDAIEYEQLCVGVRRDGKIVSVCVENFLDNGKVVEVSVETLPEYRGRGFAKACLAFMNNLLVDDNREMLYMCSCRNMASIRTAISTGLVRYGMNYYYVCQKKEN